MEPSVSPCRGEVEVPARAAAQGLTLVHFSAQLEHFLWGHSSTSQLNLSLFVTEPTHHPTTREVLKLI
jgi:hypothetical protein